MVTESVVGVMQCEPRNKGSLEARQGKERVFSKLPKGIWPYQHLDFGIVTSSIVRE